MSVMSSLALWFMKERLQEIEQYAVQAREIQENELKNLLEGAALTEYGIKHHFSAILMSEKMAETYAKMVPISEYEDIKPYVERMQKGEQSLLWHSNIYWFSKSSGTTSDRSKYIPVSYEALNNCHFKGGKDMYSLYLNNYGEKDVLAGKSLSMGGSLRAIDEKNGFFVGDISAVIMKNLPFWAEMKRVPSIETALMSAWETKIVRMAEESIKEDVSNLVGVPSWTMVLIEKVLELSGKEHILEVWPNLEVFFHGGVSFTPYKEMYKQKILSSDFNYFETYNASEGYFAMQDVKGAEDMLLMIDYGVYYELMPMDEIDGSRRTIPLWAAEINKNYALIISTNAGLWRYMIGDTIMFTQKDPYRIRITGRTKNFINAFGEEVIIDNAEKALEAACFKTDALIKDYTAGPIYMGDKTKASHQWLIEFAKEPSDKEVFVQELDKVLQQINSDYEAKRYKNMVLDMPEVIFLPKNSFYEWMRSKGKLGGQNKVPRLSNHRQYLDEILQILQDLDL